MLRCKSLLAIPALLVGLSFNMSCAKKKMSDRDTRREQLRNTAETKRQELSPATGLYRGVIKQGDFDQDATLQLVLKDVPDTSAGEVDPVLVPILTGSLRLTYGDAQKGEFYSFGVQKADFDKNRGKIDILAVNEQHSEVLLSLTQNSEELEGNWNAPASSASGEVALARAEPLNLTSTNVEIRGEYEGILTWDTRGSYQRALLTLSTLQDKQDYFTISGTVKLNYGDPSSGDLQSYSLDQVEFNPLTRKISLKGATSDVYFIGQLEFGKITGEWFEKRLGKIGSADFQKNGTPATPTGSQSMKPVAGEYAGYAVWDSMTAYQAAHLSVVSTGSQGDLKLSAVGKMIFGNEANNENLVYKFDNVEFNAANGYTVFKTANSDVTIKGILANGKFEGEWFTAMSGRMGSFLVGRDSAISAPGNMALVGPLKGTYQGELKNTSNQTNLPERFMMGLVTVPDLGSPQGIKVTGNVRFYLGPFDSLEYQEAACEFLQFDFYRREIVCKLPASLAITVKGSVGPGGIKGNLFHDTLNDIATFDIKKSQ